MEKPDKTKTMSIGGQALLEGVMMRGPGSMALSVRDPAGDIQLETYRLAGKKWYQKVPIIRGIVSFVSSLVAGMKMLTRSAEVSSPEEESLGKGSITFAVVIGILLAVGIFIALPEGIAWLIDRFLLTSLNSGLKILVSSLISGITRIVIFVVYLLLCSLMKDIKRTFKYHGAEHRTINCYESGQELTIENIQKCSTIHRRCGTTFIFLVMVVSILVFAVTNYLLFLVGLDTSQAFGGLYRMLIKLALLPFVAGLSYEVLKLFAIMPYNWFTKILQAPGLALQKITTAKPDDEMVEVALKSFTAVLDMEENPELEEVKFFEHKYEDVKNYVIERLRAIDAEDAEAYWILSDVTGVKRGQLPGLRKIPDAQFKRIKEILMQRYTREPLDYILGYSVFYGRKIKVNKDVIVPRMETEVLCSAVLEEIGDRRGLSILDLCTGSGCIALTLLSESDSSVTAADISERALNVAAQNLEGKHCELLLSDLFSNISRTRFDIIVSNPPYIKSDTLSSLQPEVQMQPKLALDGGIDGLYYYQEIIKLAPDYLKNGGVLFFEIGYDQGEEVSRLLEECFTNIQVIKDLDGNDRVVRATKK